MGIKRFKRGTLRTAQFDIPYAVCGAGPKALICVSGPQQTMAAWRPVVRRMTGTGYRVILFSYPAQAQVRTQGGPPDLTLPQQVEVLHRVAGAVAPAAPVSLIAGSSGSPVAAAYAASYPRRVSTTVLGPQGGFERPETLESSVRSFATAPLERVTSWAIRQPAERRSRTLWLE